MNSILQNADKGEGVQICQKFADVVCDWSLFARDLRQLDGVGHDEQPLEDAARLSVRAVQVLGVAQVDDAAAPRALLDGN